MGASIDIAVEAPRRQGDVEPARLKIPVRWKFQAAPRERSELTRGESILDGGDSRTGDGNAADGDGSAARSTDVPIRGPLVDYSAIGEYGGAAMRLYVLVVACVGVLATGCPDKKAKYPACGKDKDCKEGEYCVNKQCRQCKTDEHCPRGRECKNGACVLKSGACDTSADCSDGQVCKNHVCTACQSDKECGPSARCTEDGRCVERGKCMKDEDCQDDEDCLDGQCQRPGGSGKIPDCELKTIYFGFDRSQIEETSKDDLNSSAECIQKAEGTGVELAGHTDPRGTDEYNIALSEARAQAVADYLARLGIDPARFHVIPKGEADATGTDEGSWGKDRRVELGWQ
jgi:peptidoglycan-associated lipoprotein